MKRLSDILRTSRESGSSGLDAADIDGLRDEAKEEHARIAREGTGALNYHKDAYTPGNEPPAYADPPEPGRWMDTGPLESESAADSRLLSDKQSIDEREASRNDALAETAPGQHISETRQKPATSESHGATNGAATSPLGRRQQRAMEERDRDALHCRERSLCVHSPFLNSCGEGIQHTVRGSESLNDIALEYDVPATLIWIHPTNRTLRRLRGSIDTLVNGDRLFVPDVRTSLSDLQPVGCGNYVVKDGDCILSIASKTGHTWERVWDAPENTELKSARVKPHQLMPGDRVSIPAIQTRTLEGETEMRHRFLLKGQPAQVRLYLRDARAPLPNEPYELEIDGQLFSNTTDADGSLLESVVGDVRTGTLRFRGRELHLLFGFLNPAGSTSGIQQRLCNLGYDPGATLGSVNSSTGRAAQSFQEAHGLNATGDLDQATVARLEQLHDRGIQKPCEAKEDGGHDHDSKSSDFRNDRKD